MWPEIAERSLDLIKDTLDAEGAWYQQQLPVLGFGGEVSDEDRADGLVLEPVQAAEIEDHPCGGRLESVLEAAGETVGVLSGEIATELNPDDVPPVRNAYLEPGW